MRPHGGGAQRAVEADGERPRMPHRVPEGGRRLARQRAARKIGDRARNHNREEKMPFSAKISSAAKIAALAFSVSKIVSIRMMSEPPSISPRSCWP